MPYFETFPERLLKRGVPANVHRMHWHDLPGGEKVALWMKLESHRTYVRGDNWYVVTSEPEHHKVLPMIVRDYMYMEKEARFVRLGSLVKLLETKDEKQLKLYATEGVVVIADFFTTSLGPRERPFTTLQRGRLEELLLSRKDRSYPTILQVHNPGQLRIDFMPWWTRTTMDQMEMRGLRVNSILGPASSGAPSMPPDSSREDGDAACPA